MGLTEQQSSNMQSWSERADDEDTQKLPVMKPQRQIEDKIVTISKEATVKSNEGTLANHEATALVEKSVAKQPDKHQPGEMSQTQAPETPLQIPATQKKHIIPSRRTSHGSNPSLPVAFTQAASSPVHATDPAGSQDAASPQVQFPDLPFVYKSDEESTIQRQTEEPSATQLPDQQELFPTPANLTDSEKTPLREIVAQNNQPTPLHDIADQSTSLMKIVAQNNQPTPLHDIADQSTSLMGIIAQNNQPTPLREIVNQNQFNQSESFSENERAAIPRQVIEGETGLAQAFAEISEEPASQQARLEEGKLQAASVPFPTESERMQPRADLPDDPERTPLRAIVKASEQKDSLEADLQQLQQAMAGPERQDNQQIALPELPTTPLEAVARPTIPITPLAVETRIPARLSRKRAFFFIALLSILVINATLTGFGQFFGPHGWGTAFNTNSDSPNLLLTRIAQNLHNPGSKATTTPTPMTPLSVVNTLIDNMTLDQKLGQLMLVQFYGPDYSLDLSTMIKQYHIGSVLIFKANNNIFSKDQLTGLISQMKQDAELPLMVSIDQEGGTVDRLIELDGPQKAASVIGATGDPSQAYQQGVETAQFLASYGFNMNLAPVVDVTNVYNEQMDGRTFGDNPTIVTQMAGAYLQGLQKSGQVLGTLKHFPGLGDVAVDPHVRPPDLTRPLDQLNAIDWAPYKALIDQGNVYSVMVTHEFVTALDSTLPSSLSPKVIGVLRNQLGFKGVIMTDSLTMDSISNFYTFGDAAAKAIEAGDDMLMGAASPSDVAQMIDGIKKAIDNGEISQQRIDDSVRRILLMKYQMGLLHL